MKIVPVAVVFCVNMMSCNTDKPLVSEPDPEPDPSSTFTTTVRLADDNIGYRVEPMMDGGFVVSGSSGSALLVIRFDKNGDTLWTARPGFTSAFFVRHHATGNIRIATLDGTWLTLDAAGSTQSVSSLATDAILGGVSSQFDGYCLTGYKNFAASVIRIAESGDTLWNRPIQVARNVPIEYDEGWAAVETHDSSFVIAGLTYYATEPVGLPFLACLDAGGNIKWSHSYKTPKAFELRISQTSTGYRIAAVGGVGQSFLLAVSPDGDSLNYQELDIVAEDISPTNDGGFVACGRDSASVRLWKFDANDHLQWTRSFGGADAWSAVQTGDGGYAITGYTTVSGNKDVILIKTDELGQIDKALSINVLRITPNEFAVDEELLPHRYRRLP